MEESSYSQIFRNNAVPILLGVAGVIFLAIGFFTILVKNSDKSELEFKAASDTSASESSLESSSKIVVDVEGAVLKPGIYSLSSGSRVHDLIVASGGLSESADREWFTKNLNQAAKLADGQKIYIPRQGEDITTAASIVSDSVSGSGLIGINSGSIKDLDTLPGVGLVTAQKIVDNRPYGSIDELLSRNVVTSSVFEKIKDKISTN